MSLFHSSVGFICADYFGDDLPLPLPAVKIMDQKRKMDAKDTTAAKNFTVGAVTATDNVASPSKQGSTKYRQCGFTPAFDGLHPFESFVYR